MTLSPLPDEALWTDYDGDLPTADYTVTDCGQPGGYVKTNERSYSLGLAEVDYCTAGETCKDDVVTYTATDHIGTSRTHTDATAKLVAEPVYTAFGEPVSEGGYDTRYGYVGKSGYESLARLNWGQWDPDGSGAVENVVMPFLHIGARWYDPAIGRFLQRDPIGISGGPNVYEYAHSNPATQVDPTGEGPIDIIVTGQWSPSDEVWEAGRDEFARSFNDRFLGTIDGAIDTTKIGSIVKVRVGGHTFDPENRADARRTSEVIVAAAGIAVGCTKAAQMVAKKAKKVIDSMIPDNPTWTPPSGWNPPSGWSPERFR